MHVAFLTALMILLAVLCYLHSGLLGADQSQQKNNSSSTHSDPVTIAISAGKKLRDEGRLPEAIAEFARAVDIARAHHDTEGQVKSLIMLGVGQFSNFQYRVSLGSLQEAETLAGNLHNPLLGGMVCGNIATVYSLVGDWQSAESESARAITSFRSAPKQDGYTRARLARALQSHAYMCFRMERNNEAYRDSLEATELAEAIGDLPLQALLWDVRGSALLKEHKIPDATSALHRALVLSIQIKDEEGLPFVKQHLAELELEKPLPDWGYALRLIDEASKSSSHSFKTQPQYIPIHIRAQILRINGNKVAALAEFKRAVMAANLWRLGALPGDSTNTQTVAALEEVYEDYAQLAAELALKANDDELAVSGLEVLAENRAASLREQLRLVYGSNWKLPDEYFFKLSQLQSAQADVVFGTNKGEDKAQLNRIRLEIADMENQIGIKPEKTPGPRERIPRRNSLRDIQHKLSRDQVLISITLGKNQSYLWAVTGDGVKLSKLPAEAEIRTKAALFASAVRSGHDTGAPADALSRALFAGLPPDVWNRSEWMFVADGALLNGIPFNALTDAGDRAVATKVLPYSAKRMLIEGRSVRFLPSELLLLDGPAKQLTRAFVGVGDPIYNLADPRLQRIAGADAKSRVGKITLARLAGSDKEIRSAARESEAADAILLTGADATRDKVTSALSADAGIVHFAVHVVSPPDQPQQAALALSVRNGVPELLTPEVVAAFHAPGSLVVLSGCSSGQGKVIPGAGLVGLSRAWLLAGASAVVVSHWPTPDGSGKFFSSFYSHLEQIKSGNTAQRAALALRRTQVDMLHGKGYQASPAFWGAFAVISKE